jgi:hypothetical protein
MKIHVERPEVTEIEREILRRIRESDDEQMLQSIVSAIATRIALQTKIRITLTAEEYEELNLSLSFPADGR